MCFCDLYGNFKGKKFKISPSLTLEADKQYNSLVDKHGLKRNCHFFIKLYEKRFDIPCIGDKFYFNVKYWSRQNSFVIISQMMTDMVLLTIDYLSNDDRYGTTYYWLSLKWWQIWYCLLLIISQMMTDMVLLTIDYLSNDDRYGTTYYWMGSHTWTIYCYINIWPWLILTVKIQVMHIATMNILKTVTGMIQITIVIK